jgi:two-component system, cell cycle sensor histidine kinase and response regulator CckA
MPAFEDGETEAIQAERTEQADLKSEGHLVAAIKVAGFFLYQEEGTEPTARQMTFLDNGMRNILGIPEDQDYRARDYWIEHIHPDDLRNVMGRAIARFENEGEETVSAEYRYFNEKRGMLWFSHAAHAIERNEQGHVLRLVGAVLDITERKRVEEERNAAHARLQHILDNLQDCYFQADHRGHLTLASPSAARLYGYESVTEMLGLPAAELYADPNERQSMLRAIQENGHVIDRVGLGRKKDGSSFWVSGNIQVLRDVDGRVVGTEGMIRDITERKLVENALQESENRYRSLFENASNGIFHSTVDGRFIRVNPALARMLGYDSPAELISTITDIKAQLYVESNKRTGLVSRTSRDGWVYAENDYRRKDGGIMVGKLALRQVRNSDGSTSYLEGFVEDVTERKRAEESLRESEGRFRTLFEEAPIAIGINRNAISLHANFAFLKLFGLTDSREVVGKPVGEFWSPETRASIEEFGRRRSQNLPAPTEYEGLAQRSDGSQFPAHIIAKKVNLPDGPATAGFITDLTDRRRAEREREQMQASLAQSDRLASMGMLAAGVAHEINNPLTYVLCNIQNLAEEIRRHARHLTLLRESLQQRFGENVTSEVLDSAGDTLEPNTWSELMLNFGDALSGLRKIKEIARGLGTFSRVENDEIVPVCLGDAIRSALNIASNEIKYRAKVEDNIAQTAPVLGSEGKLSQVFLNLLINAAHAIRSGGVHENTISVRTWQSGSVVCAEVRDTGCGIVPEHLERIFDPFFSTKPVGVGSGLGLAICKNIVSRFDGKISVTSEVGKGTSFFVEFPVAREQASPQAERPINRGQVSVTGRILVVDDEPRIRRVIIRICQGYETVEAESGEQARELLSGDQRFDVILCDMMMPRVSGMDLHRWLVDYDPVLAKRVVFMTGGAFTPETRSYLDDVENPRVDKPFEAEKLRQIVDESVVAARIVAVRANGP